MAIAVPDRDAIRQGGRSLTFAELAGRSRRLANAILHRGLGRVIERDQLREWQSGQDHIALLMYNRPEYLEAMFGCFKSRTVPINVNYRYTAAEVLSLLLDARVKGIIYQACFEPLVSEVIRSLPNLRVLFQVDGHPGSQPINGAERYEDALADVSSDIPPVRCSGDDLFILYTGGTTGAPKGTLWRQSDWFYGMCQIANPDFVEPHDINELVNSAAAEQGGAQLVSAPLMHGAAAGAALYTMHAGQTVVLQDNPMHFDPAGLLAVAERERVTSMTIVGDAFARPILECLAHRRYDLGNLRVLSSAGATLSVANKRALLDHLPNIAIRDGLGSSETGGHARLMSDRHTGVAEGLFQPYKSTCVLSADKARPARPGEIEPGWIAKSGRIPLGYLNDPERTARLFVVLEGVRYVIPGDRGRLLESGLIQFLGRDSTTINTGGEKVFAEEVEEILKRHPSVVDAMVCGRPSERWGQEVGAIVVLRSNTPVSVEELSEACGVALARYKIPKLFRFVAEIRRTVVGKPDYAWARAQLADHPDAPVS